MKHVVTACCLCDKIRDDRGLRPEGVIWQEFHLYLVEYGLKAADIRVFHTYCPSCLAHYRAFLSSSQEVSRAPKEKRP